MALRIGTLASQSYWYDEALTVGLAKLPFGLTALGVHSEAEPPLYFALTWMWTKVFGYREFELRSLSAILGILTVPVVYSAARTLFNRRVGLAAAALVAASPALISYSQEARAYSLYVFLGALSLLFFVRALADPQVHNFTWWAVSSSLALLAHYFAIFFVVPQAVWLLARSSEPRRARLAVGAFGLALAAVVPLALYERGNGADWVANTPLPGRLRTAGHFLVLGPGPGHGIAALGALAVVAALALVLRRGDRQSRQAILLIVWLGGAFVVLPIASAAVGNDYVLDRNLLVAFLPLAIALAAGIAVSARYLGPAIALLVCGLFLWADVKIATTERLQRDDWRAVARTLGPATHRRIVYVLPGWQARPLMYYDPALGVMPPTDRASELITITYNGPRPRPRPRPMPSPPPEFRRTRTMEIQRMTLTWFRSSHPTLITAPWFERIPSSDGPVAYAEGAA